MKIKCSIYPAIWITSAFIVIANAPLVAQNNPQKKPPSAEAQQILDSLNSERSPMLTVDGEVDPQEKEHVQRMIRLYELRAGFTDVEQAEEDLGLKLPKESTEAAQAQSSQDDVQQLHSEISDLRQQIQQMQQANQSSQGNGRGINDPAGAPNDPTQYPQYNSTPRFYQRPLFR